MPQPHNTENVAAQRRQRKVLRYVVEVDVIVGVDFGAPRWARDQRRKIVAIAAQATGWHAATAWCVCNALECRGLTHSLDSHNLLVMRRDATVLPEDALSQTLAALADPTRRSILEQLSLGDASVKELAKPYDMSQPAVSKHLKVLEAAGLVSQAPGNRLGPRHLELQPFLKAAEWMDAYSRIWAARLSRLGSRRARTTSPRSKS